MAQAAVTPGAGELKQAPMWLYPTCVLGLLEHVQLTPQLIQFFQKDGLVRQPAAQNFQRRPCKATNPSQEGCPNN